jgi:hypothetical protein
MQRQHTGHLHHYRLLQQISPPTLSNQSSLFFSVGGFGIDSELYGRLVRRTREFRSAGEALLLKVWRAAVRDRFRISAVASRPRSVARR